MIRNHVPVCSCCVLSGISLYLRLGLCSIYPKNRYFYYNDTKKSYYFTNSIILRHTKFAKITNTALLSNKIVLNLTFLGFVIRIASLLVENKVKYFRTFSKYKIFHITAPFLSKEPLFKIFLSILLNISEKASFCAILRHTKFI